MLRLLFCGLLIPGHKRIGFSSSIATKALFMSVTKTVDHAVLATAWTPKIVELESSMTTNASLVCQATERTIPFLEDVSSVPFVCRYRTDVINPLTTKQVHFLQSLVSKHGALGSLRSKLMGVISDENIIARIQTSTSKAELEDLYTPFKPPSKGSILERIQKEHPELVVAVDQLWSNRDSSVDSSKLRPREPLVQLLSTKIASEPKISMVVMDELRKHCRAKTTSSDPKYENYDDFSGHLAYLKDHQVLAIRRGVQNKMVKMSYDIDGEKMEGCIKYHLRSSRLAPAHLKQNLLNDAIHDAWTRLLRRRGTARIWNDKCKDAQERACEVFEDNLRRALLAPPRVPAAPILSLDPGYQAGIKCAVLDPNGVVVQLDTLKFLGNRREDAIRSLNGLLSTTQSMGGSPVLVALGNGHGSQEARLLVQEASSKSNTPIAIQLVTEAGASVWSVTESAKEEFPDESPASIAAISIGRRLQNPLPELVKVPPRSLGLGMYQHDISEKELDEKLHLTSVDAVATVGVDVNACSIEVLRKVPGLTKLAEKVTKARPLKERKDLLKVSGLGPKTYENCAAFCRLSGGSEPLDATLVHPESYDLANWLLNKFSWRLDEPPTEILPKKEWKTKWGSIIAKASAKFDVSDDRVIAVIKNLVDSMMNVDPRLEDDDSNEKPVSTGAGVGSIEKCSLLPHDLAELANLASTAPVRGIIGTIRNIADFGAFIDFGGHNDGLLHTSKLGPLRLSNLLIGGQLGVDILSVRDRKVSLGVVGLNQQPDSRVARPRGASYSTKSKGRSSTKRSFSSKTSSAKGVKRQRTKH